MTLASTSPVIEYLENGVSLTHSVPFQFQASADLEVVRIGPDLAETLAVLGADYSVAGGDGAAGSVTMVAAKAAGWSLRIRRVTAREQTANYTPGDAFPAETHEGALDRAMAVAQEIEADLGVVAELLDVRAFKVIAGQTMPPIDKEDFAGKFYAGDVDGNLTPASGTGNDAALRADLASPGGAALISIIGGGSVQDALDGIGNLTNFYVDNYCVVDTPAGNTAGFAALAVAINAAGGGVIDYTPGKEYLVGVQTLTVPVPSSGLNLNYVFVPEPLLEIEDCTSPVIIRLNGAQMRRAPTCDKYGSFEDDGSARTPDTMPYTGEGLATPYRYMIKVSGCSALVIIENGELDGDNPNLDIGSGWGDTGIQIPNTGYCLVENTGGVIVRGVNSHHHGQDGGMINGVATSEGDPSENIFVQHSHHDFNGRLGMAIVGGRGIQFSHSTFNWNANPNAPGSPSSINSLPASGVDFEAEGGKIVRDVTFGHCDFIGNASNQIVADSGTNVNRILFKDACRFVTTEPDTYCTWANRPGFKFEDCLLAGTNVFPWGGTTGDDNPFEAYTAVRCILSNSHEHSPTGVVGCVNNLLIESAGTYTQTQDCLFDCNRAGDSVNGNIDEIRHENATVRSRLGNLSLNGHFVGRTHLMEVGGAIVSVPGGTAVAFKTNAGHAEDPWWFTTVGVTTKYGPTISGLDDVIGTNTNAADAIATLTVGTDKQTQIFTGTLTADRAVTLATTGAKIGSRFRIKRTGAGAFNLNIGTGPLKALATNTWAEVEYDGAAWLLTAYGAL